MFNQYIWELYLKSGGNKVVDTFKHNLSVKFTKQYADFIKGLHMEYCPMDWLIDYEHQQLMDLYNSFDEEYSDSSESNEESNEMLLFDEFIGIIKHENPNDNEAFFNFIDGIPYYTTNLTISSPNLFIPYYFKNNFNVLEIVANSFKIDLPELPKKADYNARFMYYVELCNTLHSFREQNGWTPYELFAFLYDFAPKYIGGISSYIITNLPEPKGAYFIGGSKDDIFYQTAKMQ